MPVNKIINALVKLVRSVLIYNFGSRILIRDIPLYKLVGVKIMMSV